jgi:large subunit ribosomal protein L16
MFTGPRKSKYKKLRKGRLKRLDFKSNRLKFGDVGLKALESGFINARQIEAARKVMVRKMKRKGKIWIKIFPDIPITSKPTGIRMGKGKGSVSHWAAKIKSGKILFELTGANITTIIAAVKSASSKLPIKTKVFL